MSREQVPRSFLRSIIIFLVCTFSETSANVLSDDCLGFDIAQLEDYLASFNLENVPTVNMMIGEFKCPVTALPFGALKSDWARLLLLQRAQSEDPVFAEKLGRLFRILVIAYFRIEERFDVIQQFNMRNELKSTTEFDTSDESKSTIGTSVEQTLTVGTLVEQTLTTEFGTSVEQTLTTEFGTSDERKLTTEFGTADERKLTTEFGTSGERKLTTEFGTSGERKLTTEFGTSGERKLTTKVSTLNESTLTTVSSALNFSVDSESTINTELSMLEVNTLYDPMLTMEFSSSNRAIFMTESPTLNVSTVNQSTLEGNVWNEPKLTTEVNKSNGSTLTKEFSILQSITSQESKLTTSYDPEFVTRELSTLIFNTSKEETSTMEFVATPEPKLTTEFSTWNESELTTELDRLNESQLTTESRTLNGSTVSTEFHTVNKLTSQPTEFSALESNPPSQPTLTTEYTSSESSAWNRRSTVANVDYVNNFAATDIAVIMTTSNPEESIMENVEDERITESTFASEVSITTTGAKQDFEKTKGRGDFPQSPDFSNVVVSNENSLSQDEDLKFIRLRYYSTTERNFVDTDQVGGPRFSDVETTTQRDYRHDNGSDGIFQILTEATVTRSKLRKPPILRKPPFDNQFWKYIVISQYVTLAPPATQGSISMFEAEDTRRKPVSSRKRGSLNTSIEKSFRWFYNLGQPDKAHVSNVPAGQQRINIECNRRPR